MIQAIEKRNVEMVGEPIPRPKPPEPPLLKTEEDQISLGGLSSGLAGFSVAGDLSTGFKLKNGCIGFSVDRQEGPLEAMSRDYDISRPIGLVEGSLLFHLEEDILTSLGGLFDINEYVDEFEGEAFVVSKEYTGVYLGKDTVSYAFQITGPLTVKG